MKVDPDGVLASLIKSPILVNPYSAIESQLVKKAEYVQSRVDKLQQYNNLALAGTQLTPSQDDARMKLDEVVKHQKYVKHLTDIVQRDRQLFEKSVKAADILLTHKLDCFRSTTISQANVYGEIISRLLHPPTTAAFLSGTNGAAKITKEQVNALSRLKSAFYPTFDDCASLEELETRATDAAEIVSHIFSETPSVVDKETGLSGKEVFTLLTSIKNCDFFSEGRSPWTSGASGSVTEAPDSDCPDATSTGSVEGDTNEEISFPLTTESTHPERSNGADYTDMDELKSVVKSVVSEEAVSKHTTSSSSWKSEEKINDENLCSADASDSGNGTTTHSSDIQSVVAREVKKKPNYGPKKRNTASYNGEWFESGRYISRPFGQPRDGRYRDRPCKAKSYRYGPESGEQLASKKSTSMGVKIESGDIQTKQRDRRAPRKQGVPYQEGKLVSREGLSVADRKIEDSRVQYYRQNVILPATKLSDPFRPEPCMSRRPAPTKVGFIFADKR